MAKKDGGESDDEYAASIPLITDRNKTGKVAMTSTKDSAVMSLILMTYSWTEFGLLWPILLHVATQIFQFLVAILFYKGRILPLMQMYISPQFELVETMINLSMSTNVSVTGIAGANATLYPSLVGHQQYGAVGSWIQKTCSMNITFSQNLVDLISIAVLMMLFGKFLKDLGFFVENTVLFLFRMDSEVNEKDGDKDSKAIRKAVTTPAAKTTITTVDWKIKIVVVVLIYLPHLLCQSFLVWAGAYYVIVQPSLGRLLKSALKIYFIIKISGVVLKAYTGEDTKKLTTGAVLTFKTEVPKPSSGWWQSIIKAVIVFLLALLMSVCFVYVAGRNIAQVHNLCKEYAKKFPTDFPPTCLPTYADGGTCGFHPFTGEHFDW